MNKHCSQTAVEIVISNERSRALDAETVFLTSRLKQIQPDSVREREKKKKDYDLISYLLQTFGSALRLSSRATHLEIISSVADAALQAAIRTV